MARWTGYPPENKPTHCIHGHEFTEKSTRTYVNKKGSTIRECRICHNASAKKFRIYGRQSYKLDPAEFKNE